jgi:hypothetical protein
VLQIIAQAMSKKLKIRSVSLEKTRKLWQDAKASAKNTKAAAMQETLKAFKGDLGPSLDALAKAHETGTKQVQAAESEAEKARLKASQSIAEYEAAIKARKLETDPEAAKLLATLKTLKTLV